jgi:hypothetical protein
MKFEINQTIAVLEKTPAVLSQLLTGLTPLWTHQNEGGDSWSPYDVVGHLVHGEKTDWMPRLEIILKNDPSQTFEPYDRFAQFEMSKDKSIKQLLDEFNTLRLDNLKTLRSKNISEEDLQKTAVHPELGTITLENLLSAWMVHDMGHIAQISRVMAKQYKDEVGPWPKYLTILNSTPSEK